MLYKAQKAEIKDISNAIYTYIKKLFNEIKSVFV